ncbi:MAG: hypothetical protein OEM05_18615, partial [Myxococcales bacterium]|nr:hypothetical protein [Myxococcales bacterium]
TATGKPSNHFVTNVDCAECHMTTNWLPVRFTHSSPNYPGDHRASLACADCHQGNSQAAAWSFPSYQPDCAGCHANDYRQNVDRHGNRNVSENRDCAGSGCHSVRDSGWD